MEDKYVLIEADYNDGDYCTSKTKISDEEITMLKNIVEKMPKSGGGIRYQTREMGSDNRQDSSYNYITNEEKDFLNDFLPSGDSSYSGIHTISDIYIIQHLEIIL